MDLFRRLPEPRRSKILALFHKYNGAIHTSVNGKQHFVVQGTDLGKSTVRVISHLEQLNENISDTGLDKNITKWKRKLKNYGHDDSNEGKGQKMTQKKNKRMKKTKGMAEAAVFVESLPIMKKPQHEAGEYCELCVEGSMKLKGHRGTHKLSNYKSCHKCRSRICRHPEQIGHLGMLDIEKTHRQPNVHQPSLPSSSPSASSSSSSSSTINVTAEGEEVELVEEASKDAEGAEIGSGARAKEVAAMEVEKVDQTGNAYNIEIVDDDTEDEQEPDVECITEDEKEEIQAEQEEIQAQQEEIQAQQQDIQEEQEEQEQQQEEHQQHHQHTSVPLLSSSSSSSSSALVVSKSEPLLHIIIPESLPSIIPADQYRNTRPSRKRLKPEAFDPSGSGSFFDTRAFKQHENWAWGKDIKRRKSAT